MLGHNKTIGKPTQSQSNQRLLCCVCYVWHASQNYCCVISTNPMKKWANEETVNRQLEVHYNYYDSSFQCTAKDRYNQCRASANLVCPASHEEGYDNRWKGRKHDITQLKIRGIWLHLLRTAPSIKLNNIINKKIYSIRISLTRVATRDSNPGESVGDREAERICGDRNSGEKEAGGRGQGAGTNEKGGDMG